MLRPRCAALLNLTQSHCPGTCVCLSQDCWNCWAVPVTARALGPQREMQRGADHRRQLVYKVASMTAWCRGSSVLTQFTWMVAGPLSLRRDLRCLPCPATMAPTSWVEQYPIHGLPAAALPGALSKLRHPLVLRFHLLSHEDSTTDSLSCHQG